MNTSRGLDNVAATTWQDKPTAYVRTAGSIEEKFEFNEFDYLPTSSTKFTASLQVSSFRFQVLVEAHRMIVAFWDNTLVTQPVAVTGAAAV